MRGRDLSGWSSPGGEDSGTWTMGLRVRTVRRGLNDKEDPEPRRLEESALGVGKRERRKLVSPGHRAKFERLVSC